jgi:hypothetical protein
MYCGRQNLAPSAMDTVRICPAHSPMTRCAEPPVAFAGLRRRPFR